MIDALWPYLVVVLVGFLPNEVFRQAAVFLGRGLQPNSELFTWIRIVAVALLAAVVSKLLYAPPAPLDLLPAIFRWGSVAVGLGAYFAAGRSLLVGILAGEAAGVGAASLVT